MRPVTADASRATNLVSPPLQRRKSLFRSEHHVNRVLGFVDCTQFAAGSA
jgi:hypothetical protein